MSFMARYPATDRSTMKPRTIPIPAILLNRALGYFFFRYRDMMPKTMAGIAGNMERITVMSEKRSMVMESAHTATIPSINEMSAGALVRVG